MPVDVAVEEPRARVVGRESEDDLVVTVRAAGDDISLDGVVVVEDVRAGGLDYVERGAVEMEGVGETAVDVDFDHAVERKSVHGSLRQQAACVGVAAQDLKQDRNTKDSSQTLLRVQ